MDLLDFPDEILLDIFRNLNDGALLQAINVCRKFKALSEEAFEHKYNGSSKDKFYVLKIAGESYPDEYEQHKLLFQNFGTNMKAIDIEFQEDTLVTNHWLVNAIRSYCKSLAKVNISHGKGVDLFEIIGHIMGSLTELNLNKITFLNHKWTEYTYPKLVRFYGEKCEGNENALDTLIKRNAQLEVVSLNRFIKRPNKILHAMDGTLTKLKHVKLVGINVNFTEMAPLSAMCLKSLAVQVHSSVGPLLATIQGLKSIEELKIHVWSECTLEVADINLLCSLNNLTKLKLCNLFHISLEVLRTLIVSLPHLVSLSLGRDDKIYRTADHILSTVRVCRRLSHLKLEFLDQPTLDYDFFKQFVDIMETNDCNLKLEMVFYHEDKIIVTRDVAAHQCERNLCSKELSYCIHYWKGYDAAVSSSDVNLFDLNQKVLKNITSFLDADALAALFKTSKRGRQLAIESINASKTFHCAASLIKSTNENVFIILGQYIHRIEVDLNNNSCDNYYDENDDEDDETGATYRLKTKFMKCVNQYCGNVLTEMKITGPIRSKTVLHWPTLRKLEFSEVPVGIFQLFRCPELTHLKILQFGENIIVDSSNDISFPKLTNLWFGHYDDEVEAFVCGLDRISCSQLKELYVMGPSELNHDLHLRWIKLTKIIVRFGRLEKLHLSINGIEKSNYKYLFENCSMLVELTIIINWSLKYLTDAIHLKLISVIKQNCKEIKAIRLVGDIKTWYKSTLQKMAKEVTFG